MVFIFEKMGKVGRDTIITRLVEYINNYPFLEKKINIQRWEERYISYGYKKPWAGKKLLFWININPKYEYVTVVFVNYNNWIVEEYPLLLSFSEEKTDNIMKIKLRSAEDIKTKWVEELIDLYAQTIWKKYGYI